MEVAPQYELENVQDIAGNEKLDYWVRRSAASGEAFCMLCVLVQKDRGRCADFMSAKRYGTV